MPILQVARFPGAPSPPLPHPADPSAGALQPRCIMYSAALTFESMPPRPADDLAAYLPIAGTRAGTRPLLPFFPFTATAQGEDRTTRPQRLRAELCEGQLPDNQSSWNGIQGFLTRTL